jgi:hypothetical protein
MSRRSAAAASAANFIATARKYIGYQSELLGRNTFGNIVGYDSQPWAGAFIDVVARESGLRLPSFTYVPAALAEFVRSGHVTRTPRPGDIAIFNFSSTSIQGVAASAFNMPAAGIVIDVRELRTNGRFLTIEGNTTGQSSFQDKDGVHQRVRHLTDVIIFCRPAEFERSAARSGLQLLTKIVRKLTGRAPGKIELATINEAASKNEVVKIRTVRTNTRNRSIELIQLALSQVTEIQGAERGKLDGATTAAIARFQRNIGRVGRDATGMPDVSTLQRLASETGLFEVE